MPEVTQTVRQLSGASVKLGFTPQVLPTLRGLVSMLYVTSEAAEPEVASAFAQAYPAATTPFVRLRGSRLPQLKDPVMTNYCDIGWTVNPELRLVTVVSAIDNLTKGASGQAVQNLNLMFGWPEATGLS
jgi:N-acetyl-gamma-glutamyl-phosphate reductase